MELGYRLGEAVADTWSFQRAIARDEELNGGRVVVCHRERASFVLYLCTDAQAWGTVQRFTDRDAAEAEANRIVAVLEAATV